MRPISPYGISKVAEELLALQYNIAHSLGITIVRPFNLIGPRQADSYICGKLIRQAGEIMDGKREAFDSTEVMHAETISMFEMQ